MQAFSDIGVICGVLHPHRLESEALKQADIVVLDWHLADRKPGRTLALLQELLTGSLDQNALRLVAVYTGEPDLGDIYGDIFQGAERCGA